MPAQKAAKPPIPRWAWIFAAACFAIPVFTIGGAIPTAIGAFSGLGVMGIARQTHRPLRSKVIYCSVITGSAWTVFLVFLFALTALQAKHPKLRPARNVAASRSAQVEPAARYSGSATVQSASLPAADEEEMTPAKRRKIYRMAVSMRYHIDSAKEQRAKLRAKGFDVSSRDEQIARLKEREQDHFDFVTRFHKIDRDELAVILAEGDRNNWPTR